jgi:serine/threonine protein kinase
MSDTKATSSAHNLPLQIGARVKGFRFEYKVVQVLGTGGRGHAFLVEAIGESLPQGSVPQGKCVLKTVRVDERRSADEVFQFAGYVHQMLIREFRALRRLRALPCVPEVFDFGQFGFNLQNADDPLEAVPLTFIVREHIEGERLDRYLQRNFGETHESHQDKRFLGIRNPRDWFKLGQDIASALLQIQLREVVHRDIWHENILVDKGQIRFIDFGDAYFRQEVAIQSSNDRADPYVAPEVRLGSRWPSRRSDIYSMGGVLFYMATGGKPPDPIVDPEVLRETVERAISSINPSLYYANHGIADIIARCLRSHHHERILDAEMLLEELRVFDIDLERPSLKDSLETLNERINKRGQLPELFDEIAAIEVRHLSNVLEGMELGAVDINGDQHRLASGLTHYLSVLKKGDEYLSVSTSDFWAPWNVGIDGQFLSMNRVVAQRGVTIRRLFLVTDEEMSNPTSLFHKIARAHLQKQQDLDRATTQWMTYVKVVDARRKDDAIDFFHHFGVWIKGEQAVRILPVYSRHAQDERRLRAIRVRKYEGSAQIIREEFDRMVKGTVDLKEIA